RGTVVISGRGSKPGGTVMVSLPQPMIQEGETFKAVAMASILSDGILEMIPFSYLYTVCFDSPICSARAVCDIPSCSLRYRIRSPFFTVSPPFVLLISV